jgi:ribosomal protein L11 methyltransferase
MTWLKLRINTTTEAVDWVRTLLSTTAYRGTVQVIPYDSSTAGAQDAPPPDWAYAIDLYLLDDFSSSSQLNEIDQRLSSLYRVGQASEPEITELDEITPSRIAADAVIHRMGQRVVVVSPKTTYRPQTDHEILLKLEESLAFGSGLHPATRLSLQLLERHVLPGMTGLDLGSGSGILSVAMAKLGATVLALDNDPVAVQATQHAVALNQVESLVTVMKGSLGAGSNLGNWMGSSLDAVMDTLDAGTATIEPRGQFDIVVANILARIHIALASDFQQALQQPDGASGCLITAGFTTDYEPDVSTALKQAGFELIDCERLGEWVALAHRLM